MYCWNEQEDKYTITRISLISEQECNLSECEICMSFEMITQFLLLFKFLKWDVRRWSRNISLDTFDPIPSLTELPKPPHKMWIESFPIEFLLPEASLPGIERKSDYVETDILFTPGSFELNPNTMQMFQHRSNVHAMIHTRSSHSSVIYCCATIDCEIQWDEKRGQGCEGW